MSEPFHPKRKVFLSYSRSDHKMASNLQSQFSEHGIDVWLDKQELPLGAVWWEYIKKDGIEASEAVLFLMTPESLASPVCNVELYYALIKAGKRIIGIRYKDFKEEDVSANLSERMKEPLIDAVLADLEGRNLLEVAQENRKFLSNNNNATIENETNLAPVAKYILEGLNTNPNYLLWHSFFARKFADWVSDGKTKANRLIGDDLAEAEQYRDKANIERYQPPLPEEQLQYIRFSRDLATKDLQRFVIFGIGIALAMLVLAVVATFNANWANRAASAEATAAENERFARAEAETRETEAIDQRNIAQRVAQTFAMVDNTLKIPVGLYPQTPLLVGTDLWVSNRDDNTVLRLAGDTGVQRETPISVGESPRPPISDGTYIWVSNAEGSTLTRIDPMNTANIMMIEVGNRPGIPVFSSESLWVIAGLYGEQGLVQIDRITGEVRQHIELGRNVDNLQVDSSGDLWVTIDDASRPRIARIDAEDGTVEEIEMERNPHIPIFTPGKVWLTSGDSSILRYVDSNSLEVIAEFDLGGNLRSPSFDGQWLWIGTNDAMIQFDPQSGSIFHTLAVSTTRPVFLSGDSIWIRGDGVLLSYDVNQGLLLTSTPLLGNVSDPLLVGDNLWYISPTNNVILVISTLDGTVLRSMPHCINPLPPVFDGANVWVPCTGENALARIPALLSYYGLTPFDSNTQPYTPIYTRIDGHEYLWIVQRTAGELVQFDAADGRVITSIPVGDSPLQPVYDGQRYLWVGAGTGRQVTRIDTQDVRRVDYIPIQAGEIAYTELIKDRIWVTAFANNFATLDDIDVTVIDANSLEIIAEEDLGIGVTRPVYDELTEVVWISGTAMDGGNAYRFNPVSGAILGSTPIGLVSREAVLNGNEVWIASLYPEDTRDLMSAVLEGQTGSLYRLDRATGNTISVLDLDELPSLPILAGNYLWVTQGSFEVETIPGADLLGAETTGQNPRGIMAISPETGEIVAHWSPCRNVGTPYFDTVGNYIWGICIGYDDSQTDDSGTIIVIDPNNLRTVREYQGLGQFPWPVENINGRIWVVFQKTSNIAVFDDLSAELENVFGVGNAPSQVTYDGVQYYWVSNGDDGTVQRILLRNR